MEAEWIRWISTAILGWIAWEMRALRRDISRRVPYADCNRRMDEHNEKLDRLEDRVHRQGWQLATIMECHNQLNSHELSRKHHNNGE